MCRSTASDRRSARQCSSRARQRHSSDGAWRARPRGGCERRCRRRAPISCREQRARRGHRDRLRSRAAGQRERVPERGASSDRDGRYRARSSSSMGMWGGNDAHVRLRVCGVPAGNTFLVPAHGGARCEAHGEIAISSGAACRSWRSATMPSVFHARRNARQVGEEGDSTEVRGTAPQVDGPEGDGALGKSP